MTSKGHQEFCHVHPPSHSRFSSPFFLLLLPLSCRRFGGTAFLLLLLGRFCPAIRPGLSCLRQALRVAGSACSQSRAPVRFLQTNAACVRSGAFHRPV